MSIPRKNVLRNLTETFTYDNLNRLTVARIKGAANYFNLTYQSNGNIASKTDASGELPDLKPMKVAYSGG